MILRLSMMPVLIVGAEMNLSLLEAVIGCCIALLNEAVEF